MTARSKKFNQREKIFKYSSQLAWLSFCLVVPLFKWMHVISSDFGGIVTLHYKWHMGVVTSCYKRHEEPWPCAFNDKEHLHNLQGKYWFCAVKDGQTRFSAINDREGSLGISCCKWYKRCDTRRSLIKIGKYFSEFETKFRNKPDTKSRPYWGIDSRKNLILKVSLDSPF